MSFLLASLSWLASFSAIASSPRLQQQGRALSSANGLMASFARTPTATITGCNREQKGKPQKNITRQREPHPALDSRITLLTAWGAAVVWFSLSDGDGDEPTVKELGRPMGEHYHLTFYAC